MSACQVRLKADPTPARRLQSWGPALAGPAVALIAGPAVGLIVLLIAALASADIILSATGLNNTLKKLERLKQAIDGGPAAERGDALYQLGLESDALATLINEEIAAHGMQEKGLIDLALVRLKELGIGVAYNPEKRQFFYDGRAFREYLKIAARGRHAAGAEFKIIEHEFYTSTATVAAAERKQAFLRRYPRFESNAAVSLMLAVDYQDLYRRHATANDDAGRNRYAALARKQFQITAAQFPEAEEAQIAEGLLKRLESELARRPRER